MKNFTTTGRAGLPITALTTLLLLAACGGGSQDMTTGIETGDQQATRLVIAPLLDDEGRVMPSDPSALPADTGARTRAGRYATTAQAEQLERALGERAIRTDVADDADAAQAVSLAVLSTYGMQAVLNLGNDAPVLVRGQDLRQAAAVADRLQEDGYTRVFLVTQ